MDSAADANAPVRFGILGAARVAPIALIGPARQVPGVSVSAVASRDTARAEAFARKHGIPRVHLSYRQLLDDPAIDAVYVPLPNSLHYEWGIEALRAGKHVLCEKPLAANAREAGQMGEVARETGRILAEGMHYRYHPLAARVSDIVRGGRIGSIRRIVA
jgi:predicted dehydrogenase